MKHGSTLLDNSFKNRFEQKQISSFDSRTNYLTLPLALLAYNSKLLYSSYLILEGQLSKIDPNKDPSLYKEIDKLTSQAFDTWVELGYRDGGLDQSDCL